jgi:hypothetical protein
MKNLKIAKNQEKFRALRLAEIQMTDKEDFDTCVKDMTKTASLELDEAKVVANAIRSKYLPNIMRESGLDTKQMVNLDSEAEETADFANDDNDDDKMEMHHFEDDEEDTDDDMSDDDMMDDEDEVEDTDTAVFEIEVPADMVDAAKQAVQEALDNLLGGDEDSDVDIEDENEDLDEEMTEDEDSEATMHKTSNKVNNMTKQALAARRAEREEILKRLASEEEKVPASASFKYNGSVELPGEVDYPTLHLQGENSLKEQNPDFADQPVPTNNPGSLNLPSITKPSKFDGSGDGSLEYTVDWDAMDIPQSGEKEDEFAIPTDMPHPHNANRAVTASEKHAVECTSCGYKMSLTDEEMNTAECPQCSKTGEVDKEDDDTDVEAMDLQMPMRNINKMTLSNNLETARIKTAFSCSSKLALAGIIDSSEIDSYAEQMLNDDLKADAMIRQTKLLLKSAQASSERVAAAAAERMGSTRTASTMGISTSPAFTSSNAANSAALDIQSALKGTWTMPQIED